MSDSALLQRVDEACVNAWPGLRQLMLDGWLLRFAAGYTSRANSASPLWPGGRAVAEKLAACESAYRAAGQPTIVRVPSFVDPKLDVTLAARGYERYDDVVARLLPADRLAKLPATVADLQQTPTTAFVRDYAALAGLSARQAELHGAVLEQLAVPACFATMRADGAAVAVGTATLWDGLICLNAIATRPDQQRRGHGRRIVAALLHWGRLHGGRDACLHVVADNHAANRLYDGIGFEPALYRYHYRRR